MLIRAYQISAKLETKNLPTNEPFFVVAFKTSDERPPYFRNSQLTNLMSLSTSELTNITIRQSDSLNRTPSNEEVKN